ncbi:MAG: hypothetical protein EON59_00540 [Alphaproteobacteria bacterium]|nr:MAG: hypothetical protein EON59_00540 [Alphaproteobacteria bacterium]
MIPPLAIGAALDFMRGKWWILPAAALALWALIERGNARHFEKLHLQDAALIERAKRESAEQLAKNERRVADATADYAARAVAQEPIILKSRETIREYAQTPAGAAQCLDAARADGVRASRNALFAGDDTGAAQGGSGAVQALPSP